jgi:hypothetical protein
VKPKPTKELAERIAERITDGVGVERAITLEGVNKTTAHRWRRFGKADDEAGTDSPNATFFRIINTACAEMLAGCESRLHAAAFDPEVDPRDKIALDKWKLSKLAREEYGDKTELIVSQVETSMGDFALSLKPHMNAPAYKEMILAIATVRGMDIGAVSDDGDEAEGSFPLH